MQELWMEVLVLGPAFKAPLCQSLPEGSAKPLCSLVHFRIKPQNIQLLVPTEEKEHLPSVFPIYFSTGTWNAAQQQHHAEFLELLYSS